MGSDAKQQWSIVLLVVDRNDWLFSTFSIFSVTRRGMLFKMKNFGTGYPSKSFANLSIHKQKKSSRLRRQVHQWRQHDERPMIAVIAKNGELAEPITRWQCDLVVEPHQPQDLAHAISRLAADSVGCAEMGKRARGMFEAEYTGEQAFERWREAFERISGGQAR